MIENRSNYLVVIIAVLLTPITQSIDQDFANPASSNIPLENFGLAELAKKLAEASEIDEKYNDTEALSTNESTAKLTNASLETTTASLVEVITDEKENSLIGEIAKTLLTNDTAEEAQLVKANEQESKKDGTALFKEEDVGTTGSESDATKPGELCKVVEKRQAEGVEGSQNISSTELQLSEPIKEAVDNVMPEATAPVGEVKGPAPGDPDSSRRFRDILDEAGNSHSVEEKLQPDQNSLFNKASNALVSKSKARCGGCDESLQKVVPDGSSFIELGCDHEEDDTIRKFQSIISLIDNVIENAGNNARKELGLCRKSKLSDAACLLTNDEEKIEKSIMQIVSCVKDALKDISSKKCIPLPRELHSFLIWLMHGSEGGGMCPPTVQEYKSKPSYLFHEDNHRPHISGNLYGTPPCPSGSLMELISASKAVQVPPNKMILSAPIYSNQIQEQIDPADMQPQYEVDSNQNANLNNRYLLDSKNEILYHRKQPYASRNYFRPSRSLIDLNIKQSDADFQRHEQANLAIRDPLEELMTYPEGSDPPNPNESEFERQSREVGDNFADIEPPNDSGVESVEKNISKRDLSRKKAFGHKTGRDEAEIKCAQRKKKRREGLNKAKKQMADLSSDSFSSQYTSDNYQENADFKNDEKEIIPKNKKDKRKDKRKKINKDTSASEENTNSALDAKDDKNAKSDGAIAEDINQSTGDAITSLKSDQSDLELEPNTYRDSKTLNNKYKNRSNKKKRKNSRANLSKEKINRFEDTAFSTVNVNLNQLIPSADPDARPNKKFRDPSYQEICRTGKNPQVSYVNKVCKGSKLKPSVVFEDDLNGDSHFQSNDDEYTDSQYALNEADDYAGNYEDDSADFYYESNEIKKEQKNNKSKANVKDKRMFKDTKSKSKKVNPTNKPNKSVKKKKKKTQKTNEKPLVGNDVVSTSPSSKTEASKIKELATETSLVSSTQTTNSLETESATELTTQTGFNLQATGLEDNKERIEKLDKVNNEDAAQDLKDKQKDLVKTESDKNSIQESAEQSPTAQEELPGIKKEEKDEKKEGGAMEDGGNEIKSLSVDIEKNRNNLNLMENKEPMAVSLKGKLYSKDVSKTKNKDFTKSNLQKRLEVKRKLSKVVSKLKKPDDLQEVNYNKSVRGRGALGNIRSDDLEDKIVSKARNKIVNDDDEDDEAEEQEEEEDDDDEDTLSELKPRVRGWAEDDGIVGMEDDGETKPRGSSWVEDDVAATANEDTVEDKVEPREDGRCIVCKPVRRRNKDRKVATTSARPEESSGGKNRLKVKITDDILSNTTSTEAATDDPYKGDREKATKDLEFTDNTMVKLSTKVPRPPAPEVSTYRTTVIQPSSMSCYLEQSTDPEQDTTPEPSYLKPLAEFYRFPINRVSFRNPVDLPLF